MSNKNVDVLQDFAQYCAVHSDQRFWQALRNWSGANFIFVYRDSAKGFDTFYWTSKDGR